MPKKQKYTKVGSMDIEEIKRKSISGVKWTMLFSSFSVILSYLTSIIIGRVSVEALALYGILTVFIAIINTFVLFGGNSSIVKFVPLIKKEDVGNFFYTYSIISVFMCLLFSFLIIFRPIILENIFKISSTFGYRTSLSLSIIFSLLSFLIVITNICAYFLNGFMEIKKYSFLIQFPKYKVFFISFFLFIFSKSFFIKNYRYVIPLMFLYVYFFELPIGLKWIFSLFKKNSSKTNFHFSFPTGFLRFAIFIHFATFFYFVYDQVDKLIVMHYLGAKSLGFYISITQTSLSIRLLSGYLSEVMLPTFSNLYSLSNFAAIQKIYLKNIKYNALLTLPFALGCIIFPKFLLSFFGETYVPNASLLSLTGLFMGMSYLGQINASLVIALGEIRPYFINSFIQIAFQTAFSIYLVKKFGLLAVVLARGIGLIIAQFGLFFIILRKKELKFSLPKSVLLNMFLLIIAFIAFGNKQTYNNLFLLFVFLLFIFAILYLGNYNKDDLNFIKQNLFPKFSQK